MTLIERLDTIWRLISVQYDAAGPAAKGELRAEMRQVVALQTEYTRLCCEHNKAKPNTSSVDTAFVNAVAEAITLLDASKLEPFAERTPL